MPEPSVRPPRADTREVAELKALKLAHPELASAVDLQLDLVEALRRVQGRVPLPWMPTDPAWLAGEQREGRPLVRFSDIPINWSDLRLIVRQTADILLRHELLEAADHRQILALAHEANALEPAVSHWYNATTRRADAVPADRHPAGAPTSLDQVLVLALRPFLMRCAEALAPAVDAESWRHGHCPFCGWEPDFAYITPGAERRLVCGRCLAQWAYDPTTCPFCNNDDRTRITSFATGDRHYRVYGCDVCHRYIKAYDGRHGTRPLMVSVDSIATLPLDAAAMQRGYVGEA